MWDAALRLLRHQPVVDRSGRPGQRFVMSLSKGEAFEIDGDPGHRLVCVVRKIDQRSRPCSVNSTSTPGKPSLDKANLYLTATNLQRRNACKVTVDPLGRLRRAND